MSQIERFIETVDEEMREERVQAFWTQNRGTVLMALAVFFIGLVGNVLWQNYRDSRDQEAANLFLTAMRAEDGAVAIKGFDTLISRFGSHGYAALARLNKAGRLADAGNTAEAVAELEALAGQTGVDPLLAQLAMLNAAYLSSDKPEKALALANGLPKDSPFLPAALEWKGILAQKKGDDATALNLFREALAMNPEGSLQGRLNRRVEELAMGLDPQPQGKP